MNDNDNVKGLGGWLILVAIGIVIGPFRLAYEYGPTYYSVFTDGTFETLTTAGSQAYHPLWGPMLIGEALYNSLMFIVSAYLIYLFFSKNYLFPKVFIAVAVVSLVFIPLDAWLMSFVLQDEPIFDPATTKEFTRALILGIIWVPYMLMSKRVKATFIEKMPHKKMQPTTESVG